MLLYIAFLRNKYGFRPFQQIVCQVAEMGISRVLLTGGEPISYPHLVQGLKLSNQFNIQVCAELK